MACSGPFIICPITCKLDFCYLVASIICTPDLFFGYTTDASMTLDVSRSVIYGLLQGAVPYNHIGWLLCMCNKLIPLCYSRTYG